MSGLEAEARERFAEMASRPNESIELDRATLLIASEEYPDLDIEHYIERLDQLAERVGSRLHHDAGPHETLARLKRVLIDDEGFCGNHELYYDPRNSYLNDVLDHRQGIPITLSALYLEVARRIQFPLQGVGFPGHFLVKHVSAQEEILVDPFNGGQILDAEALRARLAQAIGHRVREDKKLLKGTSPRQILFRILNNLKGIYVRRDDAERALKAVERMLLLVPDAPRERRDRGVLLERIDRPLEALTDLLHYRRLVPEAQDAAEVDALIERLKLKVGMAN